MVQEKERLSSGQDVARWLLSRWVCMLPSTLTPPNPNCNNNNACTYIYLLTCKTTLSFNCSINSSSQQIIKV
jgi:hypothetical protein